MVGNISILICAFVFICLTFLYLYKVWPDLDVIDLYIVFVLCHFSFYPFIRGLYFGRDIIGVDLRDANPLVVGLVFIHVLVILAIIKISCLKFIGKVRKYLRIDNLIQKFSCITKLVLISIYCTLILFQIFSYYKYGIKTYITPEEFKEIGKQLPYWFTSIRTVYPLSAFVVCLGLISSLLKSQGYYKYLWIILTVIFVPIATIYGRRFFVSIIVVWALFWICEKKKDIFSMKYLKVGLGLVCAFLLFSNVFQSYRSVFQTVGQIKLQNLENPLYAAINFKETFKNLKLRPGTWQFNFLVFNYQFNDPRMTTNGQITLEGIKSAIPKLLWPRKQFMWTDQILIDLYPLDMKQIDVGKNIFGIAQVEFGYYSLIIVPLIILSIIILMGLLIKMTINCPTFLWLFSGNILFFLTNVEENGNEIFYMLRNTVFIFIIYCFYLIAKKIIMLHTQKMGNVSGSIGNESVQN